MKKKRNTEKKVRCIVYISTVGDMQHVNQREQRPMRYISEYANGNNIEVVKVMRRNVLGQLDVSKHYDRMVQTVSKGFADGILIANMQCIAKVKLMRQLLKMSRISKCRNLGNRHP